MTYFKPVEFTEAPDPGKPVAPKLTVYNKERIEAAITKINAELDLVRLGASKHGPVYAIDPGPRGWAVNNVLTLFKTNPNDKTFQGVIQIALQDLGTNFAAFTLEVLETTKETENV